MNDQYETAGADTTAPERNIWSDRATQVNKDCYVQVTDPLYNLPDRLVLATVLKPEAEDDDGAGNGEAVRISYRLEEEVTDTTGQAKAPGTVLRPFPLTLIPAKSDRMKRAEMDLRQVSQLLVAAGLLPKRDRYSMPEIYQGLAKVEAKQVKLKLTTQAGSKRDEDGEPDPVTGMKPFRQFQRIGFASVKSGSSQGATGSGY